MDKKHGWIGVGRRKTAVASVHMRKGKGKIDINGKDFETYFPSQMQRDLALSPILRLASPNQYDLIIRLKGGGLSAQCVATRLGISRALVQENEDLRGPLKELGYLTRDPRRKERKKYGFAGARKRYQHSKR